VIPDRYVGGWVRASIALGDGSPYEDTDVVWLQAGPHFADLRIPRDGVAVPGTRPAQVMCFAGHTEWRSEPEGAHPERLRWIHDIDLLSWPADEGAVWFEGEELIEAGTFTIDGEDVAYTEVWHRLPGSDGPWSVHRSVTGLLVRVGDHALTIADGRDAGGSVQAAYRVRTDGDWQLRRALGPDAASLPEPGAAPADWTFLDGTAAG
jgi:hypothetical protein